MTEPAQRGGVTPRPAGSDVEPLVWGVLGGGAVAVVTAVTLLVSGQFTGRGLLLVFAVPLVALVVVAVARRLRAAADPGAGEPPGGGD